MKTSDPRIRVTNHGRENWRTEVQDEPGAPWGITGPPYPTATEALTHVDEVALYYFGTAEDIDRAKRDRAAAGMIPDGYPFTWAEIRALVTTAADLYDASDPHGVLTARQRRLFERARKARDAGQL